MQRVCYLIHLTLFWAGVMSAVMLVPQDQARSVSVGESVTLRCSMKGESISNYYTFWYRKTPDIQNPNPAVYQLRSPKSSNTSVCLYTDFESQANVSQVTRPVVFSSDSTVLDMGALGSKSNGVVAWSSGTDLGCADTFNQTFYPNSGECRSPCDAKIAEKSFETDMNLNFQNLSVIGFRVLLLKVVGYNLLMTLRLWSS
uniref:Ig-like domain-containing protein n=1 Tax=Phocoena sinus TaxID=42100 RepID=A0A8C9E6U5_PHOSS